MSTADALGLSGCLLVLGTMAAIGIMHDRELPIPPTPQACAHSCLPWKVWEFKPGVECRCLPPEIEKRQVRPCACYATDSGIRLDVGVECTVGEWL